MATATQPLPAETLITTDHSETTDEEIRNRVCGVLGAIYPGGDFVDHRSDHRYPYPYLIRLTPLDQQGTPLPEKTVIAVGKHLSERGLGFYHPQPLPYRRMLVTLDTVDSLQAAFIIDLAWCRFTRQGWYESGGRFLGLAPDEPPECAA